jgi:hypothetical protein
MDVKSKIEELKEEEQSMLEKEGAPRDERFVMVCWPFCAPAGRGAATFCGLGLLIIGLMWLTGSWATYLWPLIFIALGIYFLSQANQRRV